MSASLLREGRGAGVGRSVVDDVEVAALIGSLFLPQPSAGPTGGGSVLLPEEHAPRSTDTVCMSDGRTRSRGRCPSRVRRCRSAPHSSRNLRT